MGRVTWTNRARRDLIAIREYIASDNPRIAMRIAERLVTATERLIAFPDSGRVVSEHSAAGVREIIVPPYRLAYRKRGSDVRILKIHHSARLLRRSDVSE